MSSTIDDSGDLGEELDQRISAGFEISLLWLRRDNNLVVSIEDRKSGDSFELPVSSEEALEVFNHPFRVRGRARQPPAWRTLGLDRLDRRRSPVGACAETQLCRQAALLAPMLRPRTRR